MKKRTKNPYEILRLSTTATVHELIERSRELADETMDRTLQAEYVQAVDSLCRHPLEQAYHQFWEPAGTRYDDEALEGFCGRYRAPPFRADALNNRVKQFVEQECSLENLYHLALPPLPVPARIAPFNLHDLPSSDSEIPDDDRAFFR